MTGAVGSAERAIAAEIPVAIEAGGLAYAVLMATPHDLADLAVGFALSERLADSIADIEAVDAHPVAGGWVVRLTLGERVAGRIGDRVRHRASDSSCGLCGVETIEQAMRPLPPVVAPWMGDDNAVFRALAALDALQPLGTLTRAVHAAAACSRDGVPWLVREDVGRHNALDKLVGAMARQGAGWDGGFALLTSRCSYELVEKAVLAGCPMLATMSSPTTLALERAAAAGLALRVLARPDAVLAFP